MKTRARHSESGTLLIAVLVVCLGLVSITLLFASSSMMNYRGTENDLSGRQGEQAVEAGARYAKYLIGAVETKGTMPDNTGYTFEQLPVGNGYFWFIGRTTDPNTQPTEPVFGLIDEMSKLNLNNPKLTKDMLLLLPGMTSDLAESIISWRDPNGGTSSDTYGQRQPSYRRKGAPFDSVEELALLDGVDLTVLGGRDLNRNGVLDTEENDSRPTSNGTITGNASDGPGILEYLTAFGSEPNPATAADGSSRVLATTWNTAVETALGAKLQADRVSLIGSALRAAPPVASALEFYMVSQMTAEEFDQVSDGLRFSEDATLYPVNVNTASAAVLRCIPGLEDKADAIVSARLSRATTGTNASTSITWLKEVLVDPALATRAGPFLTGKTFYITADVAAVGGLGRGYRRTQFVFDASGTTPKVIYRRNLGWLGWALGREVRTLLDDDRDSIR